MPPGGAINKHNRVHNKGKLRQLNCQQRIIAMAQASQVVTIQTGTNKSIYMEQNINRCVCNTSTLTRE